eukprot:3178357-Rhodomonas_salina.2
MAPSQTDIATAHRRQSRQDSRKRVGTAWPTRWRRKAMSLLNTRRCRCLCFARPTPVSARTCRMGAQLHIMSALGQSNGMGLDERSAERWLRARTPTDMVGVNEIAA